MTIDKKYRNNCMWMAGGGIEIGYTDDGYSHVTARVVDDGGVVWETEEVFTSLEAVLDANEAATSIGVGRPGLNGGIINASICDVDAPDVKGTA